MRVRHLRPGEDWPDTIFMGFEGPTLDREWCWVVEDGSAIQAGLLACPMHGVIFLLRLAAAAGAPKIAVHALLKEALVEAKSKGMSGWTTMIDPTVKEGKDLESLVRRAGGVEWPRPTVLWFGLMSTIGGI